MNMTVSKLQSEVVRLFSAALTLIPAALHLHLACRHSALVILKDRNALLQMNTWFIVQHYCTLNAVN